LVVSTTMSEFVITNKVCLSYSLFNENKKFSVDLIYLHLSQFYAISYYGLVILQSSPYELCRKNQ